MPAATRDFTITYGSLSVGSGTSRPLHGKLGMERAGDTFSIDFSFVIRADTPALFVQEVAAVEEAFRTPNQALQVRKLTAPKIEPTEDVRP